MSSNYDASQQSSPRTPRASQSRVRFASLIEVHPAYNTPDLSHTPPAQPEESDSPLPGSTFNTNPGAVSEWHFPTNVAPSAPRVETEKIPQSGLHVESEESSRRDSGDSNATLHDEADEQEDFSRFSFSSYKHPYDIKPPPGAHGTSPQPSQVNHQVSQYSKEAFPLSPPQNRDVEKAIDATCAQLPRRRRGYLTNLIDLYNAYDESDEGDPASQRRDAIVDATHRTSRLVAPLAYNDEQILEPDDPIVTGIRKHCLEDIEDVEKNARREMNYKDRRKIQEKIRIEFNVSCKSSNVSIHSVSGD